MMKNSVKPNLTVITLSTTDIVCTSANRPEIDNGVPGKENLTKVVSLF